MKRPNIHKSLARFFNAIMIVLLILVYLPVVPAFADACVFTASGSGDWDSATTWGGGGVGTSCGAYPGASNAGDSVIISNGLTVNLNVSPANPIASLSINGTTLITGLSFTDSNDLSVSGETTLSAITTSNNNIINTLAVGQGTLSADNITISGSSRGGSRYSVVSVSSGTINVAGNITFSNTMARMTFSGAGILNIGGNLGGGGMFTPATGTVNFNGSGSQTTGGYSFNNLTLDNPSGLTLGGNSTVTSALTFNNGKIITGVNSLILPASATVTGEGAGNYVAGNLLRSFSAASSSFSFPIGDSANYAPVDLSITGITTPGNVTASVTGAACGAPDIDQNKNVNHCWTLADTGTVFSSYGATFHFADGNVVDAGAIPENFIVEKDDAGVWTFPTLGTRTTTSTQATSMTSMSNFAVGEPGIITQPGVTTVAASAVTRTSAALKGIANAGIFSMTVTFNYGLDATYGSTVTATPSPVTGNGVAVSYPLTNLIPNTTYHYQVVGVYGTSPVYTVYGGDVSFKTSAVVPTTYYVDNTNATYTCNDSGVGTSDAPFCTIANAANKADAGDTVHVVAGTYPETVIPKNNGISGNPITFNANSGVNVTGNGSTSNGGAFRITSKSYIVVNGFTVTGTSDYGIYAWGSTNITFSNNHVSNSGSPVSGSTRAGIYINGTTYSTISGNTIDHNSSHGILLTSGSNNNVVSNNVIFANAEQWQRNANGIRLDGSTGNTIIHNITYGNEDSGLNFYTGSSGNKIIGNLTYGNGDHGIDNNASPNNIFIGNTVQGNVTAGINIEGDPAPGSGGATVINNIMVDNGLQLLVGGGTTSGNPGNLRVDTRSYVGNILDYNLYYLSSGTVQIDWDGVEYSSLGTFQSAVTGQETHGLEADPLFTGPAPIAQRPAAAPYNVAVNEGDYHLTVGSPAIGSADSTNPNNPAEDIEGTPWAGDLGVYAFPRTPTTTTLDSLPNPSTYGESVTFTATVDTGATGNVEFFDGADSLGTSTLNGSSPNTATYSTSTLTAGSHSITTTYLGDSTYGASTSSILSQVVVGLDQTISYTSTAPNNAVVGGPTYTPTATATSGLLVTITVDVAASSVCSMTGGVVSFIGVGTCVINANQAGNATYNPAPQVQQSFGVKNNQTISITSSAPINAGVGGPTYTPTATATSLLTVVFTIDGSASSVCSISAGVVSFTGVGTCVVDANQAGNATYNPAPQVQQSFGVKNNQTINITSTAPINAGVGGPTYTPTATATSLLTVVFTIDGSASSVCSISAGVVSFTGVGTCVVDANQAGNATYNPAPQVQQSFGVKDNQTISITSSAPINAGVGGPTYTPLATATSGLTVVFTIDTSATSVCSISAGVVSFTGVGTCVIDANQAGNATYNPAPQVQQSFGVKNNQTISITSTAPNNAVVGGPTYTPTATATSGLPVTITVDETAVAICSMTGGVVSFISNGLCLINANQTGNATYNPALQVQQSFAVGKVDQTINITSTAPINAGVGGPTYTPTATATSGLTVVLTIDTSAISVCSISAGVVSFTGVGTCVIDANQAGNATYNPAPQVQQSFGVKNNQTISITSTAPINAGVGGPTYTPTATATSGLTVVLTIDGSASSVCSISAGVVSFTGVGTCVVDANQAGNATYNPAPQVQQSFGVKNNQTINITSTAPINAGVGGPTYTPTATATSLLTVVFTIDGSASSVCSISAGVVSFTGVGTCVVDANQAGNATYNPAPQVQQSFGVKNNQTISITSSAPINAGVGGPTYTPTATATSLLTVVFTIDGSASSVCSISAGVVSFTGVGTCVIDANQAGNATYNPAPQVQQSFAVGRTPTVSTQAVSSIKMTIATGNGNITSLGVPNPTQYGVVWSTAINPTISLSTKTAQGSRSSLGAFTSAITGMTPNTLYHVRAYATNSVGTSYGADVTFTTSIFTDVPIGYSQVFGGVTYPLYKYIIPLYDAGLTAGCSSSPLSYCPTQTMLRAESAVFMLVGLKGTTYVPPAAPWNTFADNWTLGPWAEKWAEGMWAENLTAGCQANPLLFCPWDNTPRVQAAVFGLVILHGKGYIPGPASGTVFADMTDTNNWGTKWAEQAYKDGLMVACGTQVVGGVSKPLFCPNTNFSRDWAAYLIVKATGMTPMP